MNEVLTGIIGLGVLLVVFLTGIELALAMTIVGFMGFAYLISFSAALNLLAKDFFDTFSSYGLTVVPLFVLMGQLAYNAGIAKRLYNTSHRFIGHIPGGLAIATVLGATAFKAICGSSPATAATFATVAVPEMNDYGYDKRLSTGVVATVGTLGMIIPPSVTLIVFGLITEQSVGHLFMAGLVPGLMLAFSYGLVIVGWCMINPSLGPKGRKFSWKERMSSLPAVVWPLLIFALMIGGLLNGFFTPTEAGSVAAVAVFLLSAMKGDIGFKGYIKSVQESLRTATMLFLLLAGSAVLGHFLTVTKIPMIAAQWIVALPLPSYAIIILIAFIYLVGGSFIDDLAFMILATPIFYPAVIKLGYDGLWFGIIIAITVAAGVVIPPVAICVFIVRNITKVPLKTIFAGVYPFLLAMLFITVLIFIFPQIVTYLPRVLYK
jgi:tripartite ATP-independent transporter DctM subunit